MRGGGTRVRDPNDKTGAIIERPSTCTALGPVILELKSVEPPREQLKLV
jgi:hypothetical protein